MEIWVMLDVVVCLSFYSASICESIELKGQMTACLPVEERNIKLKNRLQSWSVAAARTQFEIYFKQVLNVKLGEVWTQS